jgi:heme A synthase
VSRALLIGLYVAWPVVIAVVRARVRRRFVGVSALGWLGAVVIATTAEPTGKGLVVGLPIGVGLFLLAWIVTFDGITFEWDSSKTYGADPRPAPTGEKMAALLLTLLGLSGIAIGVLGT